MDRSEKNGLKKMETETDRNGQKWTKMTEENQNELNGLK